MEYESKTDIFLSFVLTQFPPTFDTLELYQIRGRSKEGYIKNVSAYDILNSEKEVDIREMLLGRNLLFLSVNNPEAGDMITVVYLGNLKANSQVLSLQKTLFGYDVLLGWREVKDNRTALRRHS